MNEIPVYSEQEHYVDADELEQERIKAKCKQCDKSINNKDGGHYYERAGFCSKGCYEKYTDDDCPF